MPKEGSEQSWIGTERKRRFGWLESAFPDSELTNTPWLDQLITRVKSLVRHPGLQYTFVTKRPVKISGNHLLMQTRDKEWRLVDIIGHQSSSKQKNTIARELALVFGDPHDTHPLLACEQSILFFKDILLEWVADPVKRDFLLGVGTKYQHLVEKDWRRPTEIMELEARTFISECRKVLFQNTSLEDGDKKKIVPPADIEKRMMSIARETNRRFPASCQTWITLILYSLVNHTSQ